MMTAKMAAAKIANRCQASRVSPAGIGVSQSATPSANGASATRVAFRREADALIGFLRGLRVGGRRGEAGATLEAGYAPAEAAVLGVDQASASGSCIPR